MKKRAVLVIALFLMVFMVGGVSATGNITFVDKEFIDSLIESQSYPVSVFTQSNSENQNFFYEEIGCSEVEVNILDNNNAINLYVPEGCLGGGFNLSLDNYDLGYEFGNYIVQGGLFSEVTLPFSSFGGEDLIYDETFYFGYVSGVSNFCHDCYMGWDVWEFYIDMNFIDGSGKYLNGDLYLLVYTDGSTGKPGNENILIGHIIIETYNQRLSALESWKATIDDWKDTITTAISNLWLAITGHTTKLDDHETRIEDLENKTYTLPENFTHPYFNYLSSSDRKKIVCGYAEDNHLTNIADLGWNCTISYRQTSRGESATCRCSRID